MHQHKPKVQSGKDSFNSRVLISNESNSVDVSLYNCWDFYR